MRVGEAKHQHVLHRLFAEVMVDAIDLIFGEDLVRRAVELRAVFRSVPNGFSMMTRRTPRDFIGQAGRAQMWRWPVA